MCIPSHTFPCKWSCCKRLVLYLCQGLQFTVSRMFACLTIFNSGSEGYFGFPHSPRPLLLFWLMDFTCVQELPPRVQLCLLNAVVLNSSRMVSVPSFRGCEMQYSSRFHAIFHAAHHISEAFGWRTVQTWNRFKYTAANQWPHGTGEMIAMYSYLSSSLGKEKNECV